MARLFKFNSAQAKRRMDRLVELAVEPMTTHEIAEALYISPSWACRLVDHMIAQNPRRLRLCKWVKVEGRNRLVAHYKAGSGPNAKEPPRLTAAELWQVQKADPVRLAKLRLTGRRTYHRRKGLPPPAPRPASPFAALGL